MATAGYNTIEKGNELSSIQLENGSATQVDAVAEMQIAGAPKGAGQDIAWSNLKFVVGGTSSKPAGEIKVLNSVWGGVKSGQVCAIMGPSGSGKSSLLNVLAGRSASAPGLAITGDVFVGSKKINPVAFRQNIAYVMQDDSLLATATPREALHFSASMRLPPETEQATIKALVDSLLIELGLESCADTMIGGALIKGISGGQRKRTSVGVEIITAPALLFCDEPTSGLDSYSAYQCVKLLKRVAQNNTAVLCTIHQPSSEVFFLFDLCIFLRAGQIFYQGPVSDLLAHFNKLGYECPANYNPSDHIMFLSQTVSMQECEAKSLFMHATDKFLLEWGLPGVGGEGGVVAEQNNEFTPTIKAGFCKQISLLCKREWESIIRDTAGLIGRFGVTVFLNLLFGLIFLNAGGQDDSDPANFQTHFGTITMITIASMFGCAQPVMLLFPFERPMFMREYSTGTYTATAYFLSKVVLELPLTLAQTLCQYVLVYFLCDLKGYWIYLILAAWGLGAASASVAMCLGCAVPDVKDVTELAPLLFVPQLLFAGFFVQTGQIPVFLRWAQYLCSLKYSMNIILLTEFNPSNPSCQGAAAHACAAVISNNDIKSDQWWVYVLLLIVLFVGFRILAALILVQKSKRFY